jgi:hypothetical protein
MPKPCQNRTPNDVPKLVWNYTGLKILLWITTAGMGKSPEARKNNNLRAIQFDDLRFTGVHSKILRIPDS